MNIPHKTTLADLARRFLHTTILNLVCFVTFSEVAKIIKDEESLNVKKRSKLSLSGLTWVCHGSSSISSNSKTTKLVSLKNMCMPMYIVKLYYTFTVEVEMTSN